MSSHPSRSLGFFESSFPSPLWQLQKRPFQISPWETAQSTIPKGLTSGILSSITQHFSWCNSLTAPGQWMSLIISAQCEILFQTFPVSEPYGRLVKMFSELHKTWGSSYSIILPPSSSFAAIRPASRSEGSPYPLMLHLLFIFQGHYLQYISHTSSSVLASASWGSELTCGMPVCPII